MVLIGALVAALCQHWGFRYIGLTRTVELPAEAIQGIVMKPDYVVGSNPLQAIFSRLVEDDDAVAAEARLELYLDLADLDSVTVHAMLTDRLKNGNTVLHDMYSVTTDSVQPRLELLNKLISVVSPDPSHTLRELLLNVRHFPAQFPPF